MLLQEIILPDADICNETALYIRKNGNLRYDKNKIEFESGSSGIGFDTYFNFLSQKVWRHYTQIENIELHLTLQGKMNVTLYAYYSQEDSVEIKEVESQIVDFDTPTAFNLVYTDCDDADKLTFGLEPLSDHCGFYGGGYYTNLHPLHNIKLALDICTYHREEYIQRTVNTLKRNILDNPESLLHDRLYIYITDNGRTLDSNIANGTTIKLVHQGDYGASGGFGRGLIEIEKDIDSKFITNIIIMDDDIKLDDRILVRNYLFLSYLKEEYQNHFIASATLDLNKPYLQGEFGGLWNNGTPKMQNVNKDLRKLPSIMENDVLDQNPEYSGWWYCCIPATLAREKQLPMPFFMKRDDQEYSLRNAAGIIMLNGIAVWHLPYDAKYGSYLYYFLIRNYLILTSIRGELTLKQAKKYLFRELKNRLMLFRYREAALVLSAAYDYLKGVEPFKEHLLTKDPEEFLVEKINQGYKMEPIGTLNIKFDLVDYMRTTPQSNQYFAQIIKKNKRFFLEGIRVKPFRITSGKALYLRMQDGYGASEILHIDSDFTKGFVTKRDDKQLWNILLQYARLCMSLSLRFNRCSTEWETRGTELTSEEFWHMYLKINSGSRSDRKESLHVS